MSPIPDSKKWKWGWRKTVETLGEDVPCEVCGRVIPKGTSAMYALRPHSERKGHVERIYRCTFCSMEATNAD